MTWEKPRKRFKHHLCSFSCCAAGIPTFTCGEEHELQFIIIQFTNIITNTTWIHWVSTPINDCYYLRRRLLTILNYQSKGMPNDAINLSDPGSPNNNNNDITIPNNRVSALFIITFTVEQTDSCNRLEPFNNQFLQNSLYKSIRCEHNISNKGPLYTIQFVRLYTVLTLLSLVGGWIVFLPWPWLYFNLNPDIRLALHNSVDVARGTVIDSSWPISERVKAVSPIDRRGLKLDLN